jgi:transposase-like protein
VTEKPRQKERRRFDRAFKLDAIRRMEEAGNVSALADALGVRRELLYDWREKYAAGGAEALKGSGRPRVQA